MLVTEKKGNLFIVTQEGEKSRPIGGVPDAAYGGQGGLGDVALHPNFSENNLIYLSYAESGEGDTRGAAVIRARLAETNGRGRLTDVEVVWRQYPKVVGYGHYGHRLLFDDEGYLWISSGDRQKFTPAQDMQSNLGKVVRLHDDGSVPATILSSTTSAATRWSTMKGFTGRSGRWATATCSGWHSISTASCGKSKWDRGAETN